MERATVERPHELTGRLTAFVALWWRLERWGDWARHGGGLPTCRGAMERVRRSLEDGGIRSTANDGFPDDIRILERALAGLRNRDRFQFRAITLVHIGKFSHRQVLEEFQMGRRSLERLLWAAYATIEAGVLEDDSKFFERDLTPFENSVT